MPGYAQPKWYCQLVKTFVYICRQKTNFIPKAFMAILERYANFLFWVLWVCLATHTQYDSINLQKILMFICIPKISFIIPFFLEILHFILQLDWSTAFWPITRDFSQIWDWCWNINNNISFRFRLFPGKTNEKNNLGPFWEKFGKFGQKWNFLEK